MVKNSKFFRTFGRPCRNPLAKVDGSMSECAQVSALHIRLHVTTLRRNRNDSWLKYYRRNRENRFCVTHFWPTLQNHVTDGSKHMRQLDRGEIKLFSPRCLYASIFNSFWDIWTKVSKWWKMRNFFEVFGPPCRNALADLDGSNRLCAGLCPTYWITFGIAEKNRNGRCPMHEWDHP